MERLRRVLLYCDGLVQRFDEFSGHKAQRVSSKAARVRRRGLPDGSSLARLLAEQGGLRNPKELPRLTVRQVRAEARAHRRRTGEWPTRRSGPVTAVRHA